MNIAPLMGMLGQLILSDAAGSAAAAENGDGGFAELLNAQAATLMNGLTEQELLAGLENGNVGQQLEQWLGLTLDPQREASLLAEGETTPSLGQIAAILQSLTQAGLVKNSTELVALQPTLTDTLESSPDEMSDEATVEPLTAIASLIPLVVPPQETGQGNQLTESVEATSTELGAETQAALNVAGSATTAAVDSQQIMATLPSQSAGPSMPSASEARMTASATNAQPDTFGQQLGQAVSEETTDLPEEPSTVAKADLKFSGQLSEAKPEAAPDATSISAATTPSTRPETVANVKAVELPAKLPDVPALKQVVDTIEFLSQKGENEVRLHLHPKALGDLHVQVRMIEGQVVVRMVAETTQAQSLLQDHLTQLKAAFSQQGLQVDQMSVSLNNNGSGFDASQQQSRSGLPQPNGQPVDGFFEDTEQAEQQQAVRRAWGLLRAVDYQV